MTLRGRFALIGGLVTALIVVVAGAAVVRLGATDLRRGLDDQLLARAESFGPALSTLTSRPGLTDLLDEAGLGSVRIVTADGSDLRTGSLPARLPDAGSASRFETITDGEGRWRVLTLTRSPDSAADGAVLLQFAVPTTATDDRIARLRRNVVRVGVVAIAAGVLLAWWLGGLAVAPLRRLRMAAGHIDDGDAGEDGVGRVPADQGVAEVDDVGRALNDALGRVDEQARRTAEALDASRSFAANAAHELRTPLMSMQTNLDVLATYPDLPAAERAAVIGELRTEQQRLLDRLGLLRLLARGELLGEGAERPDDEFDLADVVERAVTSARARHGDVVFDLVAEDAPVRGWSEGLAAVVDNLVENAAVHGAGEVAVAVAALDGRVRLVVDDDGPGISADEREQVFQRHRRGSRSAGSGLGLAIVHQQVALHGGSVEVADSPAGGARLAVTLPGVPR